MDKLYIVVYQRRSIENEQTTACNCIVKCSHPVIWLAQFASKEPYKKYWIDHILWYQEITEEIANNHYVVSYYSREVE